MASDDTADEEGQRERAIRIAAWFIGGICILGGIGFIVQPEGTGITGIIRSFIGGLILLITGLFALPLSRGYVADSLSARTGIQVSGLLIAGIVATGFVAGGIILPSTTTNEADSGGERAIQGASEAEEVTATQDAAVTETATETATRTKTPTETVSSSSATTTATSTPTRTAAVTETATPTATSTSTETSTPTETQTPTPTETPTPEPSGDSASAIELDVIQYTDDGNDNEHPNNEWVQFENTGDSAVNLQGWKVEDDSDRWSYTFGDVTVEPGATIRLYTGEGQDTDSEVYWGYSRAVWNDDGDVVHLYSDGGELIVEFEYSGDEGGRASP